MPGLLVDFIKLSKVVLVSPEFAEKLINEKLISEEKVQHRVTKRCQSFYTVVGNKECSPVKNLTFGQCESVKILTSAHFKWR